MSNLYNFMDGSDGLAGGMTLIGFGYYGLFSFQAGSYEFAMVNFASQNYNAHKAKIDATINLIKGNLVNIKAKF